MMISSQLLTFYAAFCLLFYHSFIVWYVLLTTLFLMQILTSRGGMTSHAAVVARGWGKPCICGCTALNVDESNGEITFTLDDGSTKTFKEGDFMSLNGQSGEVLEGEQTVAPPAITGNLKMFMEWVDEIRDIDVLTNADTPADAKEARKNGANGIGLCRSEHMFVSSDICIDSNLDGL